MQCEEFLLFQMLKKLPSESFFGGLKSSDCLFYFFFLFLSADIVLDNLAAIGSTLSFGSLVALCFLMHIFRIIMDSLTIIVHECYFHAFVYNACMWWWPQCAVSAGVWQQWRRGCPFVPRFPDCRNFRLCLLFLAPFLSLHRFGGGSNVTREARLLARYPCEHSHVIA